MKKLLLVALGLFLAPVLVAVRAADKSATPAPKARDLVVVAADRTGAIYQRGEKVTFVVQVTLAGRRLDTGEVEWTLTKDGVAPTTSGRATLAEGRAIVTGQLDEPGFLQCRVTYQAGAAKLTGVGGAAVSPREIKPSRPAPADFTAFWDAQRKRLAAVPARPRLTPVKSPTAGVDAFDLQADSLGAPVSGYFARPVGAKVRSLPAILTVHGAGVRSASLTGAAGWARDGALALDLNAHGLPNGRESAFYDGLANGELKEYRRAGRESRDTVYFLGMFLRLVRAIDVLTEQPEWDGRTMVVFGSSQGGAQAIAAAGLDPRVSFFVAGVPAMCDHTGFLAGRISGWPKFIATGEQSPPPAVVEAVRYYDAVNFAAQARAPGFFTVGFIDTTCPPSSVYAAFNALRTRKDIFNDVTAAHTNTPAASAAMRTAVKRHFTTMK